jgi:serine/threonine-protein kinase RsbW
VLDLHSNKLTYCNAGHTYPILYRKKEKSVFPLKTPGIFMGVYKNIDFENDSVYLFPEDRLYLFTDGVYSLFDNENEILARNMFEDFIQKESCQQLSHILEKLKHRYDKMITIKEQRDDITAIIVDILTQSKRNQIKKDLGFTEDTPVYLQYLSYYEEIDKVSANILKEMDETGYSDENIRKMKLTITELLANAIGHGNKDDHSKKVILGHIVETGVTTVAVMDEGAGFNPLEVPNPTLPENLTKDHGRGLYIIRNYVDEIHFNEHGNRILIRKNRFSGKND